MLRELLTVRAMSGGDDSLDQLECDLLEERCGARVVIRRTMRKLFDNLDDRRRGRLQAIMRLWCEGSRLTPEMMNKNEGRAPRSNIMLQAFKTFKVRLYGFSAAVGTMRTFIIVDCDPSKKRDKADRNILNRARQRVDEIVEEIERKGTRNGAGQ